MTRAPLMPVEEAVAKVLSAFAPLDPETVPLEDARGRVAAADILARTTNPAFDASAMDGYAVRARDFSHPPATLKVIGESAAGHPFDASVGKGEAVRIFTGAALPSGADSVLIQENAERIEDGGSVCIRTEDSLSPWRHVRRRGGDFSEGETILKAGETITPALMALLGAADVAQVPVRRRPRVAIISNGDELVMPGAKRAPGQIPASNAIALKAMVDAAGGAADDLGIAGDSVHSIQEKAGRAKDHDLLVTIGGASVGDHDLIQEAIMPMGLDVGFWRIAMRPGKPLIFGRLGEVPMLGLPGNPISALLCAFLFVLPAVRQMLGVSEPSPPRRRARLGQALGSNGPRQAYLRADLMVDADGGLVATPLDQQDSAFLTPLARARALIIRPPHADALKAGETIEIHSLEGLSEGL